MKKEFFIKEQDNGRKIFKIIKNNFKELQLGEIQKIFRKKDVKINGKRAKQEDSAKLGDKISIFIGGDMEKNFEKKKNFLEKKGKFSQKKEVSEKFFKENFKIIFEDGEILVADKPAGIAVHPGSNHPEGKTMICLAKYYLEQKNPGGDNFIQLAHRLDADTSGVLLFAKKSDSLREINEQIKKRRVDKKYFALIKGEIKEKKGKIICLVKRTNGDNGDKVILAKKGDKDALISQTNFEIKEKYSLSSGSTAKNPENKKFNNNHSDLDSSAKASEGQQKFSLMDLNIKTGRMHQIRVHMKAQGTPLVMDQMYGDFGFNKKFKKEFGLKRHFLHSYFFEIIHPKTGKKIKFNSDLSEDLKNCLKKLK